MTGDPLRGRVGRRPLPRAAKQTVLRLDPAPAGESSGEAEDQGSAYGHGDADQWTLALRRPRAAVPARAGVWKAGAMPMREDCCHFESRTYDDGEVARFCTLDLAPEAPWRCPDDCSRYERILMISSDFEQGSLGQRPPVEAEPSDPAEDIIGVLADAEAVVADAEPEVIGELDRNRRPWWRRLRRGGDDGGDFHLSNR